jgi:hypothetical protein
MVADATLKPAEENRTMNEKSSISSKRERLAAVPAHLAEAIRDAIADEDIDGLYELVNGVAEHDAEVAEFFRGLIEEYAYDTLKDLFDVRGR